MHRAEAKWLPQAARRNFVSLGLLSLVLCPVGGGAEGL